MIEIPYSLVIEATEEGEWFDSIHRISKASPVSGIR
jgi:hypothetical protein